MGLLNRFFLDKTDKMDKADKTDKTDKYIPNRVATKGMRPALSALSVLSALSLFVLLSISSTKIYAQSAASDKKITLHENQKTISTVLADISNQSGLKFSYNPQVIDDSQIVSVNINNVVVDEALNQIFKNKVSHKQVGSYIVLTEKIHQEKTGEKATLPQPLIKEITNDIPSEIIENVIIKKEILVPIKNLEYKSIGKIEHDCLYHIKLNDEDMRKYFTTLLLAATFTANSVIAQEVTQSNTEISSSTDTTTSLEKPERKNKGFNFSFIYPLGVHGINSAKSDFNFSLSVLGDITGGNKGLELASMFNINRYGVKGAQMAGLFNLASVSASCKRECIDGKPVRACDSTELSYNLQLASILNYTKAGTSTQFSGIANIADKATIQAASIVNIASKAPVQLSGIYNHADSSFFQASAIANLAQSNSYVQLSGIFNYTKTSFFQASAIGNVAKNNSPVQIAGIFNYTRNNIVQISSILNTASISKAQIGLVNIACHPKVQIGLVNVRDTADGVSLGLINIVKRGGVLEAGLEFGEYNIVAATFRSGTKHLYSILSFGYNPFCELLEVGTPASAQNSKKNSFVGFSVGYGLGSAINLRGKSNLNIEFMVHNIINPGRNFYQLPEREYDMPVYIMAPSTHWFQLRPLYTYEFGKHFKIFAGPTFNILHQSNSRFIYAYGIPHYFYYEVPYSIAGKSDFGNRTDFWIGGTLGVKF